MAAEMFSRASGLGMAGFAEGFHWRAEGCVDGWRTSWRMGWPREVRASLRADPSIPEAPEIRIFRWFLTESDSTVLGTSCMALGSFFR